VAGLLLQVDYGRDIAKDLNRPGTFTHEAEFVDALRWKTIGESLKAIIDAYAAEHASVAVRAGLESIAVIRTIADGYDVYKKAKGLFLALNTREALKAYFASRAQQPRRFSAAEAWSELQQVHEPILATIGAAKGLSQDELAVWFENAYAAYRLVADADSLEIRYSTGRVIARLAASRATPGAAPPTVRSPSDVLKGLAGRWQDVSRRRGELLVWTIEEDGRYQTLFRERSGQEFRQTGKISVTSEGRIQSRSDKGAAAVLTVNKDAAGAQVLRGKGVGLLGTTFELRRIGAAISASSGRPEGTPGEVAKQTGQTIDDRQSSTARAASEGSASGLSFGFVGAGPWGPFGCKRRDVSVAVGVPEGTDFTDEARVQALVEEGRKYALGRCAAEKGRDESWFVEIRLMKGEVPSKETTFPNTRVSTAYYEWKGGDLVAPAHFKIHNTELYQKRFAEDQARIREQIKQQTAEAEARRVKQEEENRRRQAEMAREKQAMAERCSAATKAKPTRSSTPISSGSKEIAAGLADIGRVGRKIVASSVSRFGELVEFEKTNGETMEVFGRKLYILHYRAAATMDPGFYWVADNFGKAAVVRCDELDRGVPGFLWPTASELEAGAKYVVAGEMAFRSTERGWLYEEDRRRGSGICRKGQQTQECYKLVE
jgi:hypothetical protein